MKKIISFALFVVIGGLFTSFVSAANWTCLYIDSCTCTSPSGNSFNMNLPVDAEGRCDFVEGALNKGLGKQTIINTNTINNLTELQANNITASSASNLSQSLSTAVSLDVSKLSSSQLANVENTVKSQKLTTTFDAFLQNDTTAKYLLAYQKSLPAKDQTTKSAVGKRILELFNDFAFTVSPVDGTRATAVMSLIDNVMRSIRNMLVRLYYSQQDLALKMVNSLSTLLNDVSQEYLNIQERAQPSPPVGPALGQSSSIVPDAKLSQYVSSNIDDFINLTITILDTYPIKNIALFSQLMGDYFIKNNKIDSKGFLSVLSKNKSGIISPSTATFTSNINNNLETPLSDYIDCCDRMHILFNETPKRLPAAIRGCAQQHLQIFD